MKNLANRIQELKSIQEFELVNNFPNGDLWNDCEDKITNILTHGNEFGTDIETIQGDIYASKPLKK